MVGEEEAVPSPEFDLTRSYLLAFSMVRPLCIPIAQRKSISSSENRQGTEV
jgi:hypothetical protein